MVNRKVIRKHNSPVTTGIINRYDGGGNIWDISKLFTKESLGKSGLGLLGPAGNAVNGLISNGLSSGAGNAVNKIGSTVGSAISTVNPLLGGIVSAGTGLIGGIVNALFGSKINKENVNNVRNSNNALSTVKVDSSSNDSILNQWSNQGFGADFSQSDIGKDGWFSNKAKKLYNKLKKEQEIARGRALLSYDNAIGNADKMNDLRAMSNYMAKGGKIHIKPENRGKFTALKKGTGNLSDYNMRTITKPNIQIPFNPFGDGGLMGTYGADFTNGVTVINNGGYHEENPYEGVQIGVDYNGIPNLVEEGEVIYNDYVFSNRIKVPDSVKQKYRLKDDKDLTFADAAKGIQKESEERPNDPISKRGLEDSLIKLMQEQEALRGQGQYGLEGVQYAEGGLIPDDYTYTPVFGSWKSGEMPEVIATAKRPSMIKYVDYDIPSTIEPIGIDGLYAGFSGLSPMEISGIGKVGYDIPSNVESTTPAKVRVPKRKGNTDRRGFDATWLRYAPVVGAAIGLGQNLFSRPDYTSADTILEAANQAGNYTPVEYTPIGNYLQYRPFDRNFYLNKLNAQAGATRRAIMNTTSPSRNAALLAADYNALGRLGDLARQAEEYNLAQRQAVETFNRGTNMTNSEMGLKAAMANQEAALRARSSRLSGVAQAMAMRDAIDNRRSASMSANLTNLFDSLGSIGKEEFTKDMVEKNPALLYDWMGKYKGLGDKSKEDDQAHFAESFGSMKKASKKRSKGGYLTIKKRRK